MARKRRIGINARFAQVPGSKFQVPGVTPNVKRQISNQIFVFIPFIPFIPVNFVFDAFTGTDYLDSGRRPGMTKKYPKVVKFPHIFPVP
jgi:hypothetical protein